MKVLNTSVIATFPDGSSKTYKNIEDASKKLNLSVAAIKIRCNKLGATGKDKIIFKWADPYTERHYRAKKNRNKGSDLELSICKHLKDIGYSGCVTSRSESKRTDNDKIDIIDTNGELPVNIQAKCTNTLPNYFKLQAACSDKSKPYTIIWKKSATGGKSSPGTLAIIPEDYFYELLKLARNGK